MYPTILKHSLFGYINGSLKRRVFCHTFTRQEHSLLCKDRLKLFPER
ncbi:hypothetical protein E2320_018631 [Naja naja]|nr:hypothetical protein E2320_018631 [Naja naja]